MSGFGFTEAQEMFRRQARDFARRELAPGAKERAKLEEIPRDMIKKLVDGGMMGINLPEKYGGQGADWISVGIAIEELAKVDSSLSLFPMLPCVGYLALQNAPQRIMDDWLPGAMRGENVCCFAVTEPDAGADAAGMKMTATKEGDHYILNGEKTSITMACFANAGMVFAKTDPSLRAKGVTCFWVPLDLPGITKSRIPHTGLKPLGAGSIIMEDVRLPSEYRLGQEGQGFYLFGHTVNFQRACLALLALGIAEGCIEETINHVTQRTAFGHPLAKFEGVSFKIAEHATMIEAARLLCYQTLSLGDQGQLMMMMKYSAMCKWWCPEVAFHAVHDCLLLHGHIGYSEEHSLEQRLRDVLGFEYTDSVAQMMKMIISRELMGREAAAL